VGKPERVMTLEEINAMSNEECWQACAVIAHDFNWSGSIGQPDIQHYDPDENYHAKLWLYVKYSEQFFPGYYSESEVSDGF
jgi:hypothetical protein